MNDCATFNDDEVEIRRCGKHQNQCTFVDRILGKGQPSSLHFLPDTEPQHPETAYDVIRASKACNRAVKLGEVETMDSQL
jgi:hypothetical protein